MTKIFRVVFIVILILSGLSFLIRMPLYTTSVADRTMSFVSAEYLALHVKALSEDYLPRTCTQAEKLHGAADYIKNEFDRWNSNTYYQNYQFGADKFSNVISEHGPDTEEVIIVGAHYDAYMALPGADDNASGVAGLLELNRLLSTADLSRRIVLIAYACEEPPHYAGSGMGSVVHAKSLEGKDVQLMISLEMIGYFTNEKRSQEFPVPLFSLLYPNCGDFIAVVGDIFTIEAVKLKTTINRVTGIEAYSINAPQSIPGIDFSDHRSYWAFDYPAIMVTDTAFYRNKHYHKRSDTFEKLNYVKMAKVVYGVYRHVITLANQS